MEIKVLGTGCAGCKALYETTKQAVAELGIEANIVKEEDIMQIMSYKVMKLPGLVIDEQVISSGKKLSIKEVKEMINQIRSGR